MKMEFLMNGIQVLGEVVELRDEPTQSWAVVKAKLPNDAVYEVPFRPVDRDLVCRGYGAHPLLLLQVTGRVEPRRDIFVFAQAQNDQARRTRPFFGAFERADSFG